jgi:hypothetical protein
MAVYGVYGRRFGSFFAVKSSEICLWISGAANRITQSPGQVGPTAEHAQHAELESAEARTANRGAKVTHFRKIN